MNCPHCGSLPDHAYGRRGTSTGDRCGWKGHLPSEYGDEFFKMYPQFDTYTRYITADFPINEYLQAVADFMRNKR